MSKTNLEGVTPAGVMLAWSALLEEGSPGSSEPTIHPAACESLRAPKTARNPHTVRPQVCK